MRFACWWLILGCQQAGAAEDVAAVLAVQGAPDVEVRGAFIDATPGIALRGTDRVRTDEGESLLLLLNNNRVVRIDEDLELRVDRLVLLREPPSTVPVKDQIDALILDAERGTLVGIADAERVAGWHARRAAATSVPANTARSARDDGGDEQDAKAAPRRTAPSEPSPAPAGPVASGASSHAEVPSAEALAPPTDDAFGSGLTHDVVAAVPLLEQAKLQNTCLAGYREQLGLKVGAKVEWRARIVNGQIVGWKGEGGLSAPACLRSSLTGAGLPDGEVTLKLDLP